jgi:hypothetical protein
MQVKINKKVQPERKPVAFRCGNIVVFRNSDDDKNTVLSASGSCYIESLTFDEYAEGVLEVNKIYEGDSITITF